MRQIDGKIVKVPLHSVEILEFFPHNFFCKTSVKLTFSLKIKTVYRFDEKIFKWGKISEISTLCCGNSRNSLSCVFAQILTFFREINTAKICSVKMAKIEVQNRNFQQFGAKMRRPKLNQNCRGGFKLLKSVEFTRDAAGCSELSIVEYSTTLGLNFIQCATFWMSLYY